MMLVEHHRVEAHLIAEDFLVEVFVEQLRAFARVEILVGHAEKTAQLEDLVFGHRVISPLGEKH